MGILEFSPGATPNMDALRRMNTMIAHRGPDDEGFFNDGPCGLGHRRLSIIDLGGGHQPMVSPCGRYTVCFNGEIYNYVELRERLKSSGVEFETTSDTEVLLWACIKWGERACEELNGMFAFAFWDAQERTLLLGRDHLGIKPLYVYRDADRLMFSSEVGALAQHPDFPRRLCEQAVSHYFTWRTVPHPYTVFRDTVCLGPGCTMVARADGSVRERRYWDIPVPRRPQKADGVKAEQELRELYADALRLQVRADVPVGAFLSGGVDSSTVAYWMAQSAGQDALTFTIGFKGEESDFDESEWAADVAKHIGVRHRIRYLEHYDTVPMLERIAWTYGQPCGTGIPNFFVSAVARQDVKVALAGVGGDECFGGYGRFRAANNPLSLGHRIADPERAFLRSLVSFTEEDKRELFDPGFFDRVSDEPSIEHQLSLASHLDSTDTMGKLCYLDLKHFMLNDLLFNLDKMSMAHSLEVRVPLLDHRIVEFAMRMPPRLKVAHGEHKLLPKRSMYRLLPGHVFLRPKRGFSLPKQVWLSRIEPYVRDLINEHSVESRGLFRWPAVSSYMDRVFAHEGRVSWRDANNFWNLFSFELWARQYLDRVPDLSPDQSAGVGLAEAAQPVGS